MKKITFFCLLLFSVFTSTLNFRIKAKEIESTTTSSDNEEASLSSNVNYLKNGKIVLYKNYEDDKFLIINKIGTIYNFYLSIKSQLYTMELNNEFVDENSLYANEFPINNLSNKIYISIGGINYLMKETTKTPTDLFSSLMKLIGLSNTDYARTSVMSGNSNNGNPVVGGRLPNKDYYTLTNSNDYLIFTLDHPSLISMISFHLWDYDTRVYTYSVDVFTKGEWIPIVIDKLGKSYQKLYFKPVEKVTKIRFKGSNSSGDSSFHLLDDGLSFKFEFK